MPELTEATFRRVAHARKIEICRFALERALRVRKRHKAKKVSPKFPGENIASTKFQAEYIFGIRGPFVKMALFEGSMAESIDRAPVELSPAKRRHFQTFKKTYHEKWPFVTVDEEGDIV